MNTIKPLPLTALDDDNLLRSIAVQVKPIITTDCPECLCENTAVIAKGKPTQIKCKRCKKVFEVPS